VEGKYDKINKKIISIFVNFTNIAFFVNKEFSFIQTFNIGFEVAFTK
jgi:hypothetical protein